MKSRLLVIGGGIESVPAIEHLQHLGLHIIVADGNPQAPGIRVADESIHADIYDLEQNRELALALHEKVPIHGVTTLGADVALTVACVAEALGLPGISVSTARQCHDKLAQHRFFQSEGIQSAEYWTVDSISDIEKRLTSHKQLILKPTDNRGGRGVLFIDDTVDLAWALAYSQSFSQNSALLLESYLEGPQLSTETLVVAGEVFTLGVSDRNYNLLPAYKPHIVEDGGDLPSQYETDYSAEIDKLMTKISRGLGIRFGSIKGDLVIHNGQLKVIEIALRMSGGYFASHEIPATYGTDMVKLLADMALNKKITAPTIRKAKRFICQRYLFLPPGSVMDSQPSDLASAVNSDDVVFYQFHLQPGQVVGEVHSHQSRCGMVICQGESRQEAQERAEHWVRKVSKLLLPSPQVQQRKRPEAIQKELDTASMPASD